MKVARAFDFAQFHIDKRFIGFWFILMERFTKAGRKMKESLKVIDDWAYGIIDERLERKSKGMLDTREEAKIGEGGDLLSLFMSLT
jgi:hypothetical protein